MSLDIGGFEPAQKTLYPGALRMFAGLPSFDGKPDRLAEIVTIISHAGSMENWIVKASAI